MIETSAARGPPAPVGDGSAISNRISLSTDWTLASSDVEPGYRLRQLARSPTIPTGIADHRLAVDPRLRRDAIRRDRCPAIADAVATLRDHGDGTVGRAGVRRRPWRQPAADWQAADFRGITVCMHAGGHQATTAAMVVELPADAPPRAWACLGSPCAGVFVPFFPPAARPTALTDPAQWQRFARLRDRVEADPDALADRAERARPDRRRALGRRRRLLATGASAALDARSPPRRPRASMRPSQRLGV